MMKTLEPCRDGDISGKDHKKNDLSNTKILPILYPSKTLIMDKSKNALIIKDPIKLIANIISTEMRLEDGRVFIGFDHHELPTIQGLFVQLSYVSKMRSDYLIQIDVMSFNPIVQDSRALVKNNEKTDCMDTAKERKYEIIAALRSSFSERQQKINDIKIVHIPDNFMNLSSLERSIRRKRKKKGEVENIFYNCALSRYTIRIQVWSGKIVRKINSKYGN